MARWPDRFFILDSVLSAHLASLISIRRVPEDSAEKPYKACPRLLTQRITRGGAYLRAAIQHLQARSLARRTNHAYTLLATEVPICLRSHLQS